jgi:hypothetical protein
MFIPIYQEAFEFDVKKSTITNDVDFLIDRVKSKNNYGIPQRYLDAAMLQIWLDIRKEFMYKHYLDVLDDITIQSARHIMISRLQQARRIGGVEIDEALLECFEEENEEDERTEAFREDRGFRFRAKAVESGEPKDGKELHPPGRASGWNLAATLLARSNS